MVEDFRDVDNLSHDKIEILKKIIKDINASDEEDVKKALKDGVDFTYRDFKIGVFGKEISSFVDSIYLHIKEIQEKGVNLYTRECKMDKKVSNLLRDKKECLANNRKEYYKSLNYDFKKGIYKKNENNGK